MYSKILMPTDGAPCALAAAEYARDLLKLNPSAQLTIIHIRQMPKPVYRVYRWREVEVPVSEEVQRRICEAEERILAQTEKIFTDAGLVPDTEVVTGTPAEDICAYAEKGGYDLIVMGSRNVGKNRAFIKSVGHYVLSMAKCPVLLVKA
jgi:nucleotide-binding universal stress UspA family protein